MATTFNPEASDQIRELTTDELAAVSGGSTARVAGSPTAAEVWNTFAIVSNAVSKGAANVPYVPE